MQNLSVGQRSINDLEERGEVELSTISGAFKGSATIGFIGLERLGNPNINAVLLGRNLSFVTPGQALAACSACAWNTASCRMPVCLSPAKRPP